MKATIHYYNEHGVGVFKEEEVKDLFELYTVHESSPCHHVRIGKLAVAYNADHVHVMLDLYHDDTLDSPEGMRNDRVRACRQVYALCEYYISCHSKPQSEGIHPTRQRGKLPSIYIDLKRACERELEYWRR